MSTHAHLARLGDRPRPVASAANASARAYCADQLRALGFDVAERPFPFSALPGRYAAQIIGAVALVGFAAAMLLFAPRFGAFTAVLIAALAIWMGSPDATREPWLTVQGVNLEAKRGDSPKVWLVAHIDSKSQPISSAVRSLGFIGVVVAVIGQLLVPMFGDSIVNTAGTIGGAILLMASVGARSDGAADNASGVAAVLDAAALISPDRSVGVLITDAEELALAGAANWAPGKAGIALNCDTINDDGPWRVFRYGGGSELANRAGQIASALRVPRTVMRPPPGVLTDSDAFKRAGWQTMTLARGTLRTLNRIHTERDSLRWIRGTGIPDAAKILARLVEELA